MNRLRVAILFGGCSDEHAVSVKSAKEVAKNLDPGRYEPLYVGITKAGAWRLVDHPGVDLTSGRSVMLSPDRTTHGLLVLEEGRHVIVRLDAVLPVLHGSLGEDGAVQGLLELSAIPYVGCGIASSMLCMDKSLTYLIAGAAGIATPRYRVVAPGEGPDLEDLTYPVFVKPARSGSSFGVSRVETAEALSDAVESARQYDPKVLIEEEVVGSEVGCAMLGSGAEAIVGEPDRISLSQGFFRIHQEKAPEQGSENATFVVPADISAEARGLVVRMATALYRALGCEGLARIDFFLKDDGTVVLNEVNTLPGLTSYSRYPRMMAAAGLSLADILDRVLALALTETRRG